MLKDFWEVTSSVLKERSWIDKLGKKKQYRQSLYDHTMTLVGIGCLLLRHEIIKPTDEEQRAFLLALAAHDAGKESEAFQQYIKDDTPGGSDTDLERSEQVANEIAKGMGWEFQWDDVRSAVRLHMKRNDSEGANLLEMIQSRTGTIRWRDLAQWVQDIDHVASAASPREAERAWMRSKVLPKLAKVSCHTLRLRGVSSVLLHDATKEAYEEEGWVPSLYYATGTLYVSLKPDAYPPTHAQIQMKLVCGLQEQVNQTASLKYELMHGNIIATYFVKADLFTTEDIKPLLKRARLGLNPRSESKITEDVILPAYNIAQIFKATGDPKLAKKAGQKDATKLRSNIPQEYHHLLAFSTNEMKEDASQFAKRLGSAYPEIAILKMFKNIFSIEKEIIEKQHIPVVLKHYDGFFGAGAFEALQLTSTLMPAIDMALTVDVYWRSESSLFGFAEGILIREIGPIKRQEALINVLTEIAERIWKETGIQRSTDSLVKLMSNHFIGDLNSPAAVDRSLLQEAEEQLQAYTLAKTNVNSNKEVPHVCPLCNNDFQAGKAAISDYIDKSTAFSNRIAAYASGGFHVCYSCYYERLLQQMLLGGKPGEFICLIPTKQLSGNSAEHLGLLIKEFDHAILTVTKGQYASTQFSSLAHGNLLGIKLKNEEASALSPEQFAGLFSYNKSEKTVKGQRKSIEEAILEKFNSFETVCMILEASHTTMDELIDAVIEGVYKDEEVLEGMLNEIIRSESPIKSVYRTPNFILFPTFNSITKESAIVKDKESNSKTAYKQMLIACLFAEYLNMSSAIVSELESIHLLVENIDGKVYIPNHPRVLKEIVEVRRQSGLSTSEVTGGWLDDVETVKWRKAIVAATLLSSPMKMPERDDIARVLSYKAPGEIIRRILMQNHDKERLSEEEIKQIEHIKEVLA